MVSGLIFAEENQLVWLLLVALSDLWLISCGAAKWVQGKQGHGVALTLLCRAHVAGW